MSFSIEETLGKFEIGKIQSHGSVSYIPVFSSLANNIPYRTLSEALSDNKIHISEITQGGSVPELMVENRADYPVLLLDGEELQGAKQNRVLNTTVLIKEHSQTVIPVSCTEQGRWSYNSNAFSDSGVVMSRSVRMKKNVSVSSSLRRGSSFRSDQGEIWDEIHKMSSRRNFESPTSAMKDIFEYSREDMEDYLKSFSLQEDQKGFIVGINGHIVGMDYLSSSRAFGSLYEKLLKSYVMDALVQGENGERHITEEKAWFFLKSIMEAEESVHPSVSCGYDHRYQGKNVIASALVGGPELVHLAAFPVEPGQRRSGRHEDRMAGFSRRRNFRRSHGSEE